MYEILSNSADKYHKDTLISSNGNAINVGRLVKKSHLPEEASVNKDSNKFFLYHNEGPKKSVLDATFISPPIADHGLAATRFHKGFNRKNIKDIVNEPAEKHKAYFAAKAEKGETLSVVRHDRLKSIESRNGYDPITGVPKVDNPPKQKVEGVRYCGDGLGPEAPLRGHNMLRGSENRFFTPQYSGPAHEYRQKVLVSEGLLGPKQVGVIKYGTGEYPSYGVQDQFSKSQYMTLSNKAMTGIIESSQPGRHTPRKQLSNPSGDLRATQSWGKGVTS